MHKIRIVAFAAFAAFGIGCGLGETKGGTVRDDGASTASPKAVAEETKKIAQMGKDSVELDGGLTVSISKPAKYTPGTYSIGHERGNSAFRVSVTIANNGKEGVDLAAVQIDAALGAEGIAAVLVIDGEARYPTGVVAPGQKRTVAVAYSAPTKDTSKITMNVRVGFDDRAAYFEGKL